MAEYEVEADSNSNRFVLLGTMGGPHPSKVRSYPAQVLVVNGAAYVIDCGNGVARQLVLANVPLRALRHLFITHHHSDHNADYGTLLLLAWGSRVDGLTTRVDTWGPPPLEAMTRACLDLHAYDIGVRTSAGRAPFASLVVPHEITAEGLVMEDDHVESPWRVCCMAMWTPALPIDSTRPNDRSSYRAILRRPTP
jgi:ribonuclease BN (tRNA processing enzyme)